MSVSKISYEVVLKVVRSNGMEDERSIKHSFDCSTLGVVPGQLLKTISDLIVGTLGGMMPKEEAITLVGTQPSPTQRSLDEAVIDEATDQEINHNTIKQMLANLNEAKAEDGGIIERPDDVGLAPSSERLDDATEVETIPIRKVPLRAPSPSQSLSISGFSFRKDDISGNLFDEVKDLVNAADWTPEAVTRIQTLFAFASPANRESLFEMFSETKVLPTVVFNEMSKMMSDKEVSSPAASSSSGDSFTKVDKPAKKKKADGLRFMDNSVFSYLSQDGPVPRFIIKHVSQGFVLDWNRKKKSVLYVQSVMKAKQLSKQEAVDFIKVCDHKA